MLANVVDKVKASIKRRLRRNGPLCPGSIMKMWFGKRREVVPIYVGGVQRSGTNMLMECFEGCKDVCVYHDINKMAYDKYQLRNDEEIEKIINSSFASYVVFKPLLDIDRIPGLRERFKNSFVIWIYRDYEAVVLSMKKAFPNSREEIDEVMEGQCRSWRGRHFTSDVLAKIAPLFRSDLNQDEALALAWLSRNMFFTESGIANDRNTIVLSYDRFCASGGAEFGKVAKNIGLSCGKRAIRHIHAARPKTITSDIAQDIRIACENMMKELEELERAGLH